MVVHVTGLGNIEPQVAANLSFVRPGRIAEVLVQPGDLVAEGDALARLASEDEQLAYERAVLNLQISELRKQDLTKPVDVSDVRIAQANVNSAWGAYLDPNAASPQDLQAGELRYQQALTAVDDAIYARTHAAGGQPDQAYKLLEAQEGVATFNAEIARLQLETLKNGNLGALNAAYGRVVQAQRELERVQAGPTETQINQADIAIQQAQAQVDAANMSLNQMTITAPFSGVISLVNIEVGSIAVPSLPAFELTDDSQLHMNAQIDEIDIQQVREGMKADVRLDALPGTVFQGVIERIPLVGINDNGIISYDINVRLTNYNSAVRIGMTAEASIITTEKDGVLTVPNEYIRLDRQRDKAYVNVVDNEGSLKEIEVTLGLQGDDTSEVTNGVHEGDVLAVDLGGDRISILGG
ncbi:MAG: efflux RND transporter periplasmic adaptor subunit [Anaerolineae bacterium]